MMYDAVLGLKRNGIDRGSRRQAETGAETEQADQVDEAEEALVLQALTPGAACHCTGTRFSDGMFELRMDKNQQQQEQQTGNPNKIHKYIHESHKALIVSTNSGNGLPSAAT
jgi:hypothetical protein